MRALILTAEVREAVTKLRSYAAEHVVDMMAGVDKDALPVGDDLRHVLVIPMNYRCVYSIEQQPVATLAHLSVSVPEPDKYPSVAAVNEIAKLFGFPDGINSAGRIWNEEVSPKHGAINLLQIIEPAKA